MNDDTDHKFKTAKLWFIEQQMHVSDLPAQNPDTTPMVHLWPRKPEIIIIINYYKLNFKLYGCS